MKTARFMAVAASVAATAWLLAANSAIAQPPFGFRGGPGGGPPSPEQMLERLDQNKDGTLTKDEVPESFWS